jgi:tetratricopeptide (TPR) repeat protein
MGTSDLLSMHRSLKAYVIQHMDWSEEPLVLQQTFDATVEIVRKSFVPQSATQSPSNENWDTWKEYLPQVLSLEAFYKAWKNKVMPSTAFASLLSDAGTYLFEIGLRNDSIATLEIGTEVCKRMEQDDSIVPIYANVCAIHGAILAEIGLSGRRLARVPVKKALQLRQRRIETLARSNSTTIDDFLLLSNGWNDLGVLMMQNEEFEDAMDCIQKGLNIKQEWITEKDYPQKFGESYKNLAYLLVHQDQKTEAVESARKAYELMKRANGENAQATLKGKFVYGCILLATGDLGAAKRVHKDVLEKRGKLLGEVSFITKDSNYVLGEIYRLLGKPDKAE